MGGKKKKSEAHPAASSAAPATATASVGSSDAAASGTTASLNKKKNPRQPSAKSAAKEIKAKGPKTYSFTNAPPTDPGTASNLDKSILKDLYMALQGFSFKPEHIEDAMKNTVLYGGDLHSALDWLCLNLRDDELPEGFSQKMQTEEQITKSQFQPPPEKKELPHSETKRVDEKPEAKASVKEEKVNMKEWILRYAEQESEEDDGEEPVNKEEPKDIRNFDYAARSWTGKTPKQFLIDWCRKNLPKSPQPSFEKVPAGRHWRCRVRVNKLEDGILEVCPTILTEDSMQAQHVAATLALYTLVKGQSVHQLLPPTYREVWLEWKDNEKKKEEQTKIETNKPRDQFITKLLNKLKQQQQQQQQQQQLSQGASEAADEPGESWEDLITDEDFSKISIHHEKPDDIESSRVLLRKLQSSALFQRLLRDREQLPVFQHRDTVLEAIRRNRVVVVAGETGSGKSTQVPQFILEELLTGSLGSQKCRIVCTQPRRISAMSLAVRVSEELGCEEGPGTRIRMETKAGDSTRLLYCTTGVLLRKLQQDGLLDRVSHVIVDEVHERSVQSDFLLIILKEILRKRSDLHLILMSATVDCDKFSNYFDRCPVVRIPGRTFPVEVYNLEDVVEETGYVLEQDSDYSQKFLEEEEEINVNVTGKGGKTQIHQEFIVKDTGPIWDLGSDLQNYSSRTGHAVQYMNPNKINMDLILDLLDFLDKSPQYRAVDGAVLVFLPGLAHIQQLYDLLSTDKRFRVKDRYKLIALHSTLSSKDQAAAFTVPPPGVRKIVLATNIAETGVTIPDVVFVIDTGKTKENRYRESSQMSSLVETFISKASALQRQGRAGRVREGVCFRLFTKERSKPGKSRDQPADWLKEQQSPKEISLLKAVLTAGLYDNIGKVIYTPSVDVTEKAACTVETAQGKAQVHPSSVNRVLQTYGWLLYQEKVKYAKVYVRDTTLISPFPILLFGWDIDVQHRERLLSVDSWIQFQAPVRIGVIFKQLRALIDTVLQQKLENPKMSLEEPEGGGDSAVSRAGRWRRLCCLQSRKGEETLPSPELEREEPLPSPVSKGEEPPLFSEPEGEELPLAPESAGLPGQPQQPLHLLLRGAQRKPAPRPCPESTAGVPSITACVATARVPCGGGDSWASLCGAGDRCLEHLQAEPFLSRLHLIPIEGLQEGVFIWALLEAVPKLRRWRRLEPVLPPDGIAGRSSLP
ncbi:UNVERIFIED_CONTAM: hypothetical protein FKN15_074045 [Acipenser sinensis]